MSERENEEIFASIVKEACKSNHVRLCTLMNLQVSFPRLACFFTVWRSIDFVNTLTGPANAGPVVCFAESAAAEVIIVTEAAAALAEFVNVEIPGESLEVGGDIALVYALGAEILIVASLAAEVAALVIGLGLELAGLVDLVFEGSIGGEVNKLLGGAEAEVQAVCTAIHDFRSIEVSILLLTSEGRNG